MSARRRDSSSRRSCAAWRTRSPRRRPTGWLLFANDAAVEMLGFDSAEALIDAPRQIMGRYELLHEDGEPFPVEALPGPPRARRRGNAETVVASG